MRVFLISLLLVVICVPVITAQTATKLEGQIVCCEDCWNRADRKAVAYGTLADLAKAADCVGNGDPTLLAGNEYTGAAAAGRTEVTHEGDGETARPWPESLA